MAKRITAHSSLSETLSFIHDSAYFTALWIRLLNILTNAFLSAATITLSLWQSTSSCNPLSLTTSEKLLHVALRLATKSIFLTSSTYPCSSTLMKSNSSLTRLPIYSVLLFIMCRFLFKLSSSVCTDSIMVLNGVIIKVRGVLIS